MIIVTLFEHFEASYAQQPTACGEFTQSLLLKLRSKTDHSQAASWDFINLFHLRTVLYNSSALHSLIEWAKVQSVSGNRRPLVT